MAAGQPKKFKSPEQLQKLIDAYYIDCDEREAPYTIEGLAYACNCDRRTITNYAKDSKFFPTIKRAREKILARITELAIAGKGNATSIIFNLKNNYDYKDKTESDVTVKQVKEFDDFYNS